MTPSEVPCLQNGLPARVRPNPSPSKNPLYTPKYGGVSDGTPATFTGRNHQVISYTDLHWFLMRVRYISISFKLNVSSTSVQSRPESDLLFYDSPECLPCRDEEGYPITCPFLGTFTLVRRTLPFTLNAVFIPSGIALLDARIQGGAPSIFSSLPNELMEPGYTVYTPKEGSKHGEAGALISDTTYYKYYEEKGVKWNAEGYPWDPIPTDLTRWWLHRNSPVNPAWAMRTDNDNLNYIQLYKDRKYLSQYPYDYSKEEEYLQRGEAYVAMSMVTPVLGDFRSQVWPGKTMVGIPQRLYPERSGDLFKTTSFSKLCQPIPMQPGQQFQYYKENKTQPIVQYFPYGAVDIYESKTKDQMGKTESFAEASYYVCFNTDVTTMNWEPTYEYLRASGGPLGCDNIQSLPGSDYPTPKFSSVYPPGERQGYTSGPTVRGFISSYAPEYVEDHLPEFFAASESELLGGRFYHYNLREYLPANWPIGMQLYAYIFIDENPVGENIAYAVPLPEAGQCAYDIRLQPIPQNSKTSPEVSVKVKYRSWNGAFNTDTGAWQL